MKVETMILAIMPGEVVYYEKQIEGIVCWVDRGDHIVIVNCS
jgi:hypothetical protein